MNLKTPLKFLTGIGPSLLYKLSRLELFTVGDLIYHFPFRYDDFSQVSSAIEAKIDEKVTLQGEIWSIKNIYTRFGKILTQAIFNDGASPITLTWFNQRWLTNQIQVGDRLQISGKLKKYKNKISMVAPVWEKLPTQSGQNVIPNDKLLHTGKLVPVYPETAGLTSKWFRAKIAQLLPTISNQLQDPLPEFIQDKMLSLPDALQKIHQPQDYKEMEKAKKRLSFDELFYISLATIKTRKAWSKKLLVAPLTIYPDALEEFIGKLPFTLTAAQKKVIEEIFTDLKKNQPMNRLIQGEVGSGKTVVTAIIIYLVYLNHYKTLFMAPTEILAFQHYSTISNLLEPLGIKVGIYTGSKKSLESRVKSQEKKSRFSTLTTSDSYPDVIIGTHALLSEKLITEDVGLIVIDEQQRFGVEQRSLLRSKAKVPHFLTTTATPIPRTVALVVYGDLDLSTIDELPKNRQQIKTYAVPGRKRNDAYKFIEKKIKEGDQAYLITPLIEQSETLQSVKAAKVEFEKLKKVFPDLKLGLLHGRLKGKEKDEVMQKFKDRQIDLLVSTSVVEVGMDVTNATIMVVESAERFGLAQLHQLRGRVVRGLKQSYCLLFCGIEDSNSKNRLKNLEKINDGMKLAELDLKIRGSGEIFGIRQSGRFEFKLASFSDIHLVEKTRQAAQDVLKLSPALDKYPTLRGKLDDLTKGAMPD